MNRNVFKDRKYYEARVFNNAALSRVIKRSGPILEKSVMVNGKVTQRFKDSAASVDGVVYTVMRESVSDFMYELLEKALQFSSYRRLKQTKSNKPKLTTDSLIEALKLSRYNINLICGSLDNVGPKIVKMSGGGAPAVNKVTRGDGVKRNMEVLDKDIHLLKSHNLPLLAKLPLIRLIKGYASMILRTPNPFQLNLTKEEKAEVNPILITEKAVELLRIIIEQFITTLSKDAWQICEYRPHKTGLGKRIPGQKLMAKDVTLALKIHKYDLVKYNYAANKEPKESNEK